MLALEIEYLLGVIFSSKGLGAEEVDWPPQPDRVFSALVASWGARGRDPAERQALQWLEQQDPPRLFASETIFKRTTPIAFVPPNDAKSGRDGNVQVLPSMRKRQQRRFPAGRPLSSTVRLVWNADADDATFACLAALARDTSYVGHSTSLTRCQFSGCDEARTGEGHVEFVPRFRVYEGRFAELEHRFQDGLRPSPGAVVVQRATGAAASTAENVFSGDMLVLEGVGGRSPDQFAFPLFARMLRERLTSVYGNSGGTAPSWLSGREPDGSPTSQGHVAIVPMADVGWKWSEGRLLGCAVILPLGKSAGDLRQVLHALLNAEGTFDVTWDDPEFFWTLQPTLTPSRSSLDPTRWRDIARAAGTRMARQEASVKWCTVTPIALDRFPKNRDGKVHRAEITAAVARACSYVGLPEPQSVQTSDASAISGAHAAYPLSGAPAWQRWRLPPSLAGRRLTHAVLKFDSPVRGPVILGAGRFVGLGLCLPRLEQRDV
jgi:CRISPR-associated protein Csb2